MTTALAIEEAEKEAHKDYSLTGEESRRAVAQGLSSADWYTTDIPRERMVRLLTRRNGPAIRDTVIWFGILIASGLCGFFLWGSAWAILPFAVYGVIYASSSDSRWHEASHGTAFKTDWMNNVLYEIASFMVFRESTPWRWSHVRHHTDTIIVGRDPEIAVPRPPDVKAMALGFFGMSTAPATVRKMLLHCFGRLTPDEADYIPESEHRMVFFKARIYVLIYASVIGLAVYSRSILPLMFIGLPTLYGSWLMPVYGMTQHAGLAENVLDHRLNCRTVHMNLVNRYLYWNMGYHVEHHMFPLVPYHALPELHALMLHDTPVPYKNLCEAWKEIVPALRRQIKDPGYYVRRELPPTAAPSSERRTAEAMLSPGAPDAEGWIEVCPSERLGKEDVLRFDHDEQTFAVYRTADGSCYATDGICTHGRTHLADGMVKDHLIECAKHNGRFDVRDGSVVRPPVCVALRTYDVKVDDGRIFLDLTSAGGSGALDLPVHTFRVASNRNVATFIKELVLVPENGSFTYQPGDYIQLDIPPYVESDLHGVEVEAPYAGTWKAHHVYDFRAGNKSPSRRNYSMAGNPATETQLRFNVRIATPPPGQLCNAGSGSSYVFSLKPGDTVSAIGPFGDFHIKETGREMVYIGGGAGMAPLRAHLSSLFETQMTARRVSFWYGARSAQELFYTDYFKKLEEEHDDFSFHLALSEPLPEDAWAGDTGFIHEVLRRNYLDGHKDPTQVEYYLCGPPAMIAATREMLASLGVPPGHIAFDEF